MSNLSREVCELFAPGQGLELNEILYPFEENAEESVPADIKHLVDEYKVCPNKYIKRIFIKMAPATYTNRQLMHYFETNQYEVEVARKQGNSCEYQVQRKFSKRDRLDDEKLDHFLQHLFANDVFKEQAYGAVRDR